MTGNVRIALVGCTVLLASLVGIVPASAAPAQPDPLAQLMEQLGQATQGLGLPPLPPLPPLAPTIEPTPAIAPEAAIPPTKTPIMVSLGDSYQANVGDDFGLLPTGSYREGTTAVGEGGNACFQALNNIPKRVARDIGATLVADVTCTAADTRHFTEPQYPGQPAQLDAVRPDADIVTVGMGGNPWFSPIINQMVKLHLFNGGKPIDETDVIYAQAWDYYANTLKDELVTANAKIRRRAPSATIYQSNYPPILPTLEQGIGECWWFASAASILPLQRLLDRLNQTVAEAAAESGAVLVDLTAPDSAWRTHGRVDACSPYNAGAWNLRLRPPLDVSKIATFDDVIAAVQYGSFHTTPYGNDLTTMDWVKTIRLSQPHLN